jgi:hypothetical protein
MRIQKTLAFCLFSLATLGASAQEFEGSIYFTKSNMLDVTQYAYHIKGDMVRIDEMMEGSDNLVAALLVNLETEEMIALSHERKLYMKRPKRTDDVSVSGAEVVEGTLKRSIHGHNCSQVRVKNKSADREVMFWVTDGNYDFFPKLLKILKRKDNLSTYYLNIPNVGSRFPLMAAENTLLRDKKGFLLVDRMEEKELADALFSIPDGFEKVER